MRALHSSLEREAEQNRQLRRIKEQVVAVALRLQVAVKCAQQDEVTTVELRRDASEARLNAAIANKRVEEATEIIQTLKLEISSLKRKVRELQAQDEELPDVNSASLHTLASVDVDKMTFNLENKVKTLRNTGGHPERATPFQQWKMQKFIFTPDTPAGSGEHDKHTVDMLADAITAETLQNMSRHQYPSQSSVGKLRRRITANEDIPMRNPKLDRQKEIQERLALPKFRNVDTLCPTQPEEGLAAFVTSMNSRRVVSPTKSKKKNNNKGSDPSGTAMTKWNEDEDLYLNSEDKTIIENAFRWSMDQKSRRSGRDVMQSQDVSTSINSLPSSKGNHSGKVGRPVSGAKNLPTPMSPISPSVPTSVLI